MEHLLQALGIPLKYICQQKTTATGMEALMILLRRLVYPNRLCDLAPLFRQSESELSLIFNKVSITISNLSVLSMYYNYYKEWFCDLPQLTTLVLILDS